MSNGSVTFNEAVPLTTAVLELVVRAGKDPALIFAVLDLHHADLMNTAKPATRLERLVILFTDWTFMHVDLEPPATRQ